MLLAHITSVGVGGKRGVGCVPGLDVDSHSLEVVAAYGRSRYHRQSVFRFLNEVPRNLTMLATAMQFELVGLNRHLTKQLGHGVGAELVALCLYGMILAELVCDDIHAGNIQVEVAHVVLLSMRRRVRPGILSV